MEEADLEKRDEEQALDKKSKAIYLLPNLFTTAALFCGFYAVIAASQNFFDNAAIAIFVAMIMDFLDGRVARMTNTESSFGAQYDSLSDMVSFGVAPALVAYHWALADLKKYGWLCAFVYAACVALRLARFNVQRPKIDKKYFRGLPSPAAAAVVAGFVWFCVTRGIDPHQTAFAAYLLALLVVFEAWFMVSNILYYSFKDFDLKSHVPFVNLLIIVVALALISVDPSSLLFLIFVMYAFGGPLLYCKTKYLSKK